VAQGEDPEFKSQYCKNKIKKIIFEQRALHFYFALGTTNYMAGPILILDIEPVEQV
jgi:hypothetical protein